MESPITILVSKYREHIKLKSYINYLNVASYIGGMLLVPIKIVKCLNLWRYYRDVKKDPETYAVSERFAEKRKHFPFFLQYRQWVMGVWIFTNSDFSGVNNPFQLHVSQITSVLEQYNLGYSSKLEIAIMALSGNTNAEKALSLEEYRVVTMEHATITDGVNWAHPNVDGLRLLYLTKDISSYRYEDLFELAKKRDAELMRKTVGEVYTHISTNGSDSNFLLGLHIVPNEGDNEINRSHSPIWARYDDLFGDQYDKPYKHM